MKEATSFRVFVLENERDQFEHFLRFIQAAALSATQQRPVRIDVLWSLTGECEPRQPDAQRFTAPIRLSARITADEARLDEPCLWRIKMKWDGRQWRIRRDEVESDEEIFLVPWRGVSRDDWSEEFEPSMVLLDHYAGSGQRPTAQSQHLAWLLQAAGYSASHIWTMTARAIGDVKVGHQVWKPWAPGQSDGASRAREVGRLLRDRAPLQDAARRFVEEVLNQRSWEERIWFDGSPSDEVFEQIWEPTRWASASEDEERVCVRFVQTSAGRVFPCQMLRRSFTFFEGDLSQEDFDLYVRGEVFGLPVSYLKEEHRLPRNQVILEARRPEDLIYAALQDYQNTKDPTLARNLYVLLRLLIGDQGHFNGLNHALGGVSAGQGTIINVWKRLFGNDSSPANWYREAFQR